MRINFVTIVLFATVCVLAESSEAQIINTLRGFNADEPGWSGEIAGAIAAADGNTEYFEFELSARIQYQTERHRWRAIGSSMRRTALGVEVAESRAVHLRHSFRLWSRLATIVFVQGQSDPFRRIETRILFGVGAGIEIFQGKFWRCAIGATPMRETEELTDPNGQSMPLESGTRTTRYRMSYFLTLYRIEKERFDIDIWGFYQPLIDEFAQARASASASFRVNIVGGLYLSTGYVVRHDSNPPPGVKKLDTVLRSGLGWRF